MALFEKAIIRARTAKLARYSKTDYNIVIDLLLTYNEMVPPLAG